MQVETLHQLMEGKTPAAQVTLLKPLAQVGVGCSTNNMLATTTTTTTNQIRASTGAVGVTDAAINATCIRLNGCLYASCTDCCIGHSNGTRAGPDLVSGGGGCGYMYVVGAAQCWS